MSFVKREAERKADEARAVVRAKARGDSDEKLAKALDDGLNPGERGAADAAEDELDKKKEKPDVLLREGAQVLADAVDLMLDNPRIAEVSAKSEAGGSRNPPPES